MVSDVFGFSMSTSGNTAIVAARRDQSPGDSVQTVAISVYQNIV
ncbi:MAG: hypothetical protein ACKVKV_01200 [Dehalococcoidia bacterium]